VHPFSFKPTYSSTYSDYGWIGVVATAPIHFFPGASLVGCRPLLLSKVRTGKSLIEQVASERITTTTS